MREVVVEMGKGRSATSERKERRTPAIPALGPNLRRIRTERGFTQEQVAARIGMSSIKMIETGQSGASVQVLMALAEVLDVGLEELLADPGAPLRPELVEFLRTPAAADITAIEIEHLKGLRARGRRPTVDTYYWRLKEWRSMQEQK